MNNKTNIDSQGMPFTIECEDILLREYKVEDLDAIFKITHEPEIRQFLPGWDVSREQRLEWLTNYEIVENRQFLQAVHDGGDVGQLRLRLAIVLKETGECIGWCNTGPKEELPPPNREIMYGISNRYYNKGYTTQAVRALIQFLFRNTKELELSAVAVVHNHASNKVIQKCGFTYMGEIELEQERHHLYKLRRES
ncbi:GNAT family N-acetyltransferase [Paenibacillus lautus]|uniref:GNAT family N-acetyltransferase n=1 Tax=Paenibacillus lautus TaxID=1401 RepID=UPI001FEA34BC|nr:GNAT family N-acetyltransferase [Paenibacillus lautus]MEC0202740.1 GNAT family N-acetyltransferase [Paenibacillus lautus]